MSRLIYTTALDTKDRAINDTELFQYTRPSWESYCKRHNCEFYVIDSNLDENTSPHWYRYWIYDLKPGYDQYLYVDADIMAKWNAPNIFEKYNDLSTLYAVRDNSGLSWIWEGIKIYENMFKGVELDWENYFNSGVMLFSKEHEELVKAFKQFYLDNKELIAQFREQYRKGFDQNIFNYFCTYQEIKVEFMSEKWNLFHMRRREIFYNSYFSEMGYFWHFNGFERDQQIHLIKQLWDQVKEKYEN